MLNRIVAIALGLVIVAAPAAVLAQDDGPARPETRKVEAMRKEAFDKLTEAQLYIAPEEEGVAPNYTAARRVLDGMLAERDQYNSNELGLVWQTYAFLYAEIEDYAGAIRAFENAIATRGLAYGQELSLKFNLAQLYMAEERFGDAITAFTGWMEEARRYHTVTNENPDWQPPPNAYVMLASAYAQTEQYRAAIPPIRTAIEIADEPQENWYQLLLAMYFELQDYETAETLLEFMVDRFPGNETYWNQLGAIYGEREKEKPSFAVLELNYMQGFVDKTDEIERLAQLYMFYEVPYKAGVLLEQEFDKDVVEENADNYELFANAWFNAREYEKALGPLEQAASLSDEGNLYYRLGQAQFELQNFSEAAAALRNALNKGGLDNAGRVWLLLGITRNNQGNRESAIEAFERALDFDSTRNDAQSWINFIRQLEEAGA